MNKKRIANSIYRRYSIFFDAVNRNALVAQWTREYRPPLYLNTRNEIYRYVAAELGNGSAIDLLEFGVAEGTSMRALVHANQNPESRFVGFDTFAGLPEDWQSGWGVIRKGSYAVRQDRPYFDDARISLQVGLFQDTVPKFLTTFTPANQLIFHIDCDLYSSTLYLLTKLDAFRSLQPIILFDDFSSPLHVFRAFTDYVGAYQVSYRCLAAAGSYFDQVCVQLQQSSTVGPE